MQTWNWSAGMLLLAVAGPSMAAGQCTARSGPVTTPLVELYTAEGCNSCPPADRWMSKRITDQETNWLAFHVDYWDKEGWPDRFASPAHTLRQRARVILAEGKDAIFTPQVMVGTNVQANWRSDGRFNRVLEEARQPAPVVLAFQAQPGGKSWDVRLDVAPVKGATVAPAEVWLVQYIDDQDSRPRAGENRGVSLHHDRVVHKLWGPWKLGTGSLSKSVSVEADPSAWGMTAFVQTGKGDTLQSLSLPAASCAAGDTASR
jgi:hypothetical protein